MANNINRKIIACFPLYPPLELFHSMGLNPFVLWGLQDQLSSLDESNRRLQSYTCSVARCLTQFLIDDQLHPQGIFFYNACDTLRNLPEILETGLSEKEKALPFFRMHLPMAPLKREFSRDFFRLQINRLVDKLEKTYGLSFSEDTFLKSAQLYSEIRSQLNAMEKRVASGEISYADFSDLTVRINGMPPEKQLHEMHVFRRMSGRNNEKARGILISGILPPPPQVIKIIEASGLRVAGNDVATQRRTYGYQPQITGNPVEYYEDMYINHFPCPTLLYTADKRLDEILNLIVETGAKGVIFAGEKFCEYEYMELPWFKKILKENGIPTLTLEFSAGDSGETGSYKTRIEAFAELLTG